MRLWRRSRYKRSKKFQLDQRACAVRPKQPDFGYSGAEFPRAYARIPKPVSTGVQNAISSGSALVNIRRKALLSSVGFRKRMTSRSLRGSSCDSCIELRFDLLMISVMFVSRSCLAFSIISRLIQPRRCHCICLERMF